MFSQLQRVLTNRPHQRISSTSRRARLERLEDRCLLTLTSFVDESSQVRAMVPTDGSLGTIWTGGDELFDDSSWATSPPGGPNGVGYERSSGYDPFIGIDVESTFFGNMTSVYIRIPFNKEAIQSLDTLTLNMRYDDGFAAYLNGVRVASSPGVPANDTDVEEDDLAAQLVAGPSNGAITFDPSGTFTYTPDDGFVGVDQFTYVASDGQRASPPALVTINIGDANMVPTAAGAWYTTRRDQPLLVLAGRGLLARSRDLNRDPLTLVVDQGPSDGTLEMAPDGGFLYTPAAGFQRSDSFVYYLSDGQADSSPAEVAIDVVFKVDPPDPRHACRPPGHRESHGLEFTY